MTIFSHITRGSADIVRSRRFYEPVMAVLGIGLPFSMDGGLVFDELAGE